MKSANQIFLFAALWLVLCGCPEKEIRKSDMQLLRENHYDFKDFTKLHYKDIYFDSPNMLQSSFTNTHLYKKDGLSMINNDLGVFLSVERFNEQEAEAFRFGFEDELTKLDAVHEFYMAERRGSLMYFENSIKSVLPEGSKLSGSLEVVYGRREEFAEDLKYIIATVEKDNNWYVFQMVVGHEMSSYLFDDFKEIIKSIR